MLDSWQVLTGTCVEFETSALLPREGLFDWEVPGAEFLLMTSQKLRIQATIASQVLFIAFWISRKSSPEREILATLGVIHPFILVMFPTDESNTAGMSDMPIRL